MSNVNTISPLDSIVKSGGNIWKYRIVLIEGMLMRGYTSLAGNRGVCEAVCPTGILNLFHLFW